MFEKFGFDQEQQLTIKRNSDQLAISFESECKRPSASRLSGNGAGKMSIEEGMCATDQKYEALKWVWSRQKRKPQGAIYLKKIKSEEAFIGSFFNMVPNGRDSGTRNIYINIKIWFFGFFENRGCS